MQIGEHALGVVDWRVYEDRYDEEEHGTGGSCAPLYHPLRHFNNPKPLAHLDRATVESNGIAMNVGCGTLGLVMVDVEELLAKRIREHTLGAILKGLLI